MVERIIREDNVVLVNCACCAKELHAGPQASAYFGKPASERVYATADGEIRPLPAPVSEYINKRPLCDGCATPHRNRYRGNALSLCRGPGGGKWRRRKYSIGPVVDKCAGEC